MPAEYLYLDGATGVVASAGRPEGGPSIPLVDPSSWPAGEWVKPARLIVRRGSIIRTVLKGTGRSGSSVLVDGPLDGYADKDLAAGDVVSIGWTRADVEDLWDAVDAAEGEQGPQGPKGDKGDAGDPGPQGEQGPQGPKGDEGDAGAAGAKGDKGDAGAPGPNTVSGLIAIPNDGSIAIEGGAGTAGDPIRLRAKRRRVYAWMVADSAAGATGDASTSVPAPYACKLVAARMYARINPTGTISGQVKGAGSNLLGSSLSISGGTVGPASATIASPPSIAAGAAIVATWSALPTDARGVVIEAEILED